MGQPAPLSLSDRASLRALAAKVVASAEHDAKMPLPGVQLMQSSDMSPDLDAYVREDVESLVMQLCQALTAERADFHAAARLLYRAVEGGPWTAADNRSASALYKLAGIET